MTKAESYATVSSLSLILGGFIFWALHTCPEPPASDPNWDWCEWRHEAITESGERTAYIRSGDHIIDCRDYEALKPACSAREAAQPPVRPKRER